MTILPPDLYDRAFFEAQRAGSAFPPGSSMSAAASAPDALEVDAGLVTALNLDEAGSAALRRAANLPADGAPGFDLALCLETAEHMRPEASARFVAGLCALSDAVLFSAAVPHQGGYGHVNERWPSVWAALFAERGFACFDHLRPAVWLRPEVEWCYAQNALLFARGTAADRLRAHGPPVAEPLPLVHPRRFAMSASVSPAAGRPERR